MATDNLKVHFHLTLRGWIADTRWLFGNVQGSEHPRPADAIASFELHITQSSKWSPENRAWKELWRSDTVTDGDVASLVLQLGKQVKTATSPMSDRFANLSQPDRPPVALAGSLRASRPGGRLPQTLKL